MAGDKNFIPDGIVDEAQWENVSPKILYILKEPNDSNSEDWSLQKFLELGAAGEQADGSLKGYTWTWGMLTQWTYGILNGFLPYVKSEPKDNAWKDFNERAPWLQQIAAINIKKTGGGGKAKDNKLWEHAEEHCKELRQQILGFEPHPQIIICCGSVVSQIFWSVLFKDEMLETETTKNGVKFALNKSEKWLAIKYCHPQARYPSNFKYSMLIDAVKELEPF